MCHPLSKNIVISNTNCFSEKIPDHNRKTGRQHDYLYYQPQPSVQNHRKQYRHDRRLQKGSYKNDYDRGKGVAHFMIHSGIPTPKKQATPIIPLKKDYNSRKKANRFILNFIKERNQQYKIS